MLEDKNVEVRAQHPKIEKISPRKKKIVLSSGKKSEYSIVRSVKTQLIYCKITSMTSCFDSQGHHEVNLEPYQFRYTK